MTIPRELGLAKVKDEIVLTQQPLVKPTYEIKTVLPEKGVIGLEGFVKVGYNADSQKVFINEYEANYEPPGNQLHLKVIVDRASVELITGDGTRSITLAVFPPAGTSRDLTTFGL